MPLRAGFDNERYLEQQRAAINERVARFGDKLYLEFGGKLLFDFVHYDGTTWSFVERGPDGYQLLFGTPLTEAQLNRIK